MRAKQLITIVILVWSSVTLADDATRKSYIQECASVDKRSDYRAETAGMEAALKEAETFGPNDPRLFMSLAILAELYQKQGRYTEAEPLYKRLLAITEKAQGPDDKDVAVALDNLADLYMKQDRYTEAEPLYKRSLAITEKKDRGLHDVYVGMRLDKLAQMYAAQSRYNDAELLYKRSLAILENALGEEVAGTAP